MEERTLLPWDRYCRSFLHGKVPLELGKRKPGEELGLDCLRRSYFESGASRRYSR